MLVCDGWNARQPFKCSVDSRSRTIYKVNDCVRLWRSGWQGQSHGSCLLCCPSRSFLFLLILFFLFFSFGTLVSLEHSKQSRMRMNLWMAMMFLTLSLYTSDRLLAKVSDWRQFAIKSFLSNVVIAMAIIHSDAIIKTPFHLVIYCCAFPFQIGWQWPIGRYNVQSRQSMAMMFRV